MKRTHSLNHSAAFWTMAMLLGAGSFLPGDISAAQRLFSSPEEAVKALQAATEAQDKAALHDIFGPEYDQLLTGDVVQDQKNAARFAAAVAQACKPVPEGEDRVTLEVGTNNWPVPIPLLKAYGQWHFDTDAGKEEIILRHIGKDELHAIGVCRAYVKAQQQYASADAGPDSSYALKFKSTPGKKDGLYWPSAENQPASPFGPVVAAALTDGNVNNTSAGPQPFHGYFFRILTGQGPAAHGGKKNYMSQGMLSGGFALVAYPERWDRSGIMTFIVNQDGVVYERNLGEKTSRIARKMEVYNPDINWKPAQDEGILSAVSEQIIP